MNEAKLARETHEDWLMNIEELCSLLSLSRAKVYRMVRQGELPYVRLGGSIRFRYRALLDWMKGRETQPEQAGSPAAKADLLIPCGQEPLT